MIIAFPSHRDLGAIHQDTSGVYGAAETGDRFGEEVDLSIRGNGTIGKPETVVMAAQTVFERLTPDGNEEGAMSAFRMIGAPGDHDVWITRDTFGLSMRFSSLRGSRDRLYLDYGSTVYGLPWANIFDGASDPITEISAPWQPN